MHFAFISALDLAADMRLCFLLSSAPGSEARSPRLLRVRELALVPGSSLMLERCEAEGAGVARAGR